MLCAVIYSGLPGNIRNMIKQCLCSLMFIVDCKNRCGIFPPRPFGRDWLQLLSERVSCVCVCVSVCLCIFTCMCVCVCVCVYLYFCVYLRVHVCVCVCVCESILLCTYI